MWCQYDNLGGNSNVEYYKIGYDFLSVKFYNTNKIYTYSYKSAGNENVENAKRLALYGQGLNSYIMHNMKFLYEKN